MSNIWFTSDEHYGHDNIIKFCNRPFADTSHMRETLIDNHNSLVKKDDFIYHLGDMFWNSLTDQECFDILARLNGRHYYILGNHEKAMSRNKALRESFVWVRDVENLQFSGYPNIFLCHYAMRVWNGSHKGAYHLYGHSHGALEELTEDDNKYGSQFSFDVGVDAGWNYFPVSLEQVKEKMIRKGCQEGK